MKKTIRRGCAVLMFAATMTLAALPVSAASDSASYTYDALGRLTKMTYANGTTIVYSYDAAGNRASVVTTCSASGC